MHCYYLINVKQVFYFICYFTFGGTHTHKKKRKKKKGCFFLFHSFIFFNLVIKDSVIQNNERHTDYHDEEPSNCKGKGEGAEAVLLEGLVGEGLVVEEPREDVHHEGRARGAHKAQDKVEAADKEGYCEGDEDDEHANRAVTQDRMPVGRFASKAKSVNVVPPRVELNGIPAPNNKHECKPADGDNNAIGICLSQFLKH